MNDKNICKRCDYHIREEFGGMHLYVCGKGVLLTGQETRCQDKICSIATQCPRCTIEIQIKYDGEGYDHSCKECGAIFGVASIRELYNGNKKVKI